MRISLPYLLVAPLVFAAAAPATAQASIAEARRAAQQAYRRAMTEAREVYQGRRGPEQTETFSRRIKVGRDGRVSISNISGAITVTAASGDEVSIDAVKRGRGDRVDLNRVRIVVEEHPGRVDVRTDYDSDRLFSRNDNVSVDYTVVVPAGASLDLYSVSGRLRVEGVNGSVRFGTVSGDITASRTPKVEYVRTVSGEIDLGGISQADSLSISSVSGGIQLAGVKARSLDLNTVSGEMHVRDAACERVVAKGVSANFEYSGALARNGRYEVNSHSGSIRFTIADNPGFELSAGSFSGEVHSDFQMTVGGDRSRDIGRGRGRGRRSESIRATFGDGSASLNLRTFSGSISVLKK
jgi:DUF4097 and DUF4098 domain-containing protein YvlB